VSASAAYAGSVPGPGFIDVESSLGLEPCYMHAVGRSVICILLSRDHLQLSLHAVGARPTQSGAA